MEGPELATHQGRCDGASAIGDHRGPTHRHALARGPSGPSRERGERDVLGVHPELVHALRHGELPGRSDGSCAGGAAPASPDGIGPGVSHGGRCARRRSEGAGSYVRRSRTDGARLDWRVRGEHVRKRRRKKRTFRVAKFRGILGGHKQARSPDNRPIVSESATGRQMGIYRSCFGFFSQLVCLQLPTPVWSGGPTVGGTPTPSPRYPMMMNPSIDASSIDSSIDSSIANSPVRVHELGVKLGELLDDAANVLL